MARFGAIFQDMSWQGSPNDILNELAASPHGKRIEAILDGLNPQPSRRTLQRYLKGLISEGRVEAEGRGPATRYRLKGENRTIVGTEPRPTAIAATPESIPLSEKGQWCQEQIRHPYERRRAVEYDRSFLTDYVPNETFYLSTEQRKYLTELGQVVPAHQAAGTHARDIFNRLLIDLSWNSSRLEGNTYSLLDTERLIHDGKAAPGKDARETQMIVNHKTAVEFLVEGAADIAFNRYTLLNLHGILADNLLSDPRAAGRLRTIAVAIGGSKFHPLEGPSLIEECFDQMLRKAAEIGNPFEAAFFIMVHLPYLQPFEDVNKRVSRFAANIPLIKLNLSPISFVDVPKSDYIDGVMAVYELRHIELLRDVFIWTYARSAARYSAIRQTLGEPDVFRLGHRQLLIDTVKRIVVEGQHRGLAIDAIHDAASGLANAKDQRKFSEMAQNELSNLHEGNFARYGIRPSQFSTWQTIWRRS